MSRVEINRKACLAILIGVGVAAAFSFIYGLSNLSRGPRQATPEAAPSLPSQAVLTKEVATPVRTTRSRYFSWGRNPFTFEERSPVLPGASLSLSGISWDKQRPQAVINGRIVGIGDVVAGYRVVGIKQDRVIVNDGSSNVELKLWRKR